MKLSNLGSLIKSTLGHPAFVLLLSLLPWILSSAYLWQLTPLPVALPLQTHDLEAIDKLLQLHRVILPYWLAPPFLISWCYFNLALLGSFFLLGYQLLPIKKEARLHVLFIFCALIYPWAKPGTLSFELLDLNLSCLMLLAFLQFRPHALLAWFTASVFVLLSLLLPKYLIWSFWVFSSLCLGEVFHFFFVDRFQIGVSFKRKLLEHLSYVLGCLSLCLFALLTLSHGPWEASNFEISPYWWVSFLGAIIAVGLTWFQPWQSRVWIRLSIMSLGLLISPELIIPVLLLLAWETLKLGDDWLSRGNSKRLSKILKIAPMLAILLGGFSWTWMWYQARTSRQERSFTADWLVGLQLMEKKPSEGFIIVGDAIGFLSIFQPSALLENPPILLESSERDFLAYMDKGNFKNIIVDQTFLRSHWKQLIAEGIEPSKINNSIFSRLILYQGEELNTKTLNLKAIKQLKAEEIAHSNLFWIYRVEKNEH